MITPGALPDTCQTQKKSDAGSITQCDRTAPKTRPFYTLAQLLAECDFTKPRSVWEREWDQLPAVGRELL